MKLNSRGVLLITGGVIMAGLAMSALLEDLPQFLGNATGVFLGFFLGVSWHQLQKREQKAERTRRFREDFSAFLPLFENRLQGQMSNSREHVFENIFEYRLPLVELEGFCHEASVLDLDRELRRKLNEAVRITKILEEYVDLGGERLQELLCNFGPYQQRLFSAVREIKQKTKEGKEDRPG